MSLQQCNSCGGFNDINKCPTCFTLICARCQTNHELGCSEVQKKKKLGLGATVRQILDTNLTVPPIPKDAPVVENPVPSVENPLAATASVENPLAEILNPIQEEPKNESVSEVVIPQEQNTRGPVVDQGSQEHTEQSKSTGDPDHGTSNADGSTDNSASASVAPVVTPAILEEVKQVLTTTIESPAIVAALQVVDPSSVVASDGQTEREPLQDS